MSQSPGSSPPPSSVDRNRVSVDLSAATAALLEHVSTVTGTPKAQIVSQALLDALPGLVERADAFQKRGRELLQAQQAKSGGKR
jgi:hypothetical protein